MTGGDGDADFAPLPGAERQPGPQLAPPGLRASRCKSCGARVYWVQTPRGRKMPLDAHTLYLQPGDGPSTGVTEQGVVVRGFAVVAGHHDVVAWESHFAHCPQAGGWRR